MEESFKHLIIHEQSDMSLALSIKFQCLLERSDNCWGLSVYGGSYQNIFLRSCVVTIVFGKCCHILIKDEFSGWTEFGQGLYYYEQKVDRQLEAIESQRITPQNMIEYESVHIRICF